MTAAQISIADAQALLGVGPDASTDELRRAFHLAVMQAHPDRPGGGVEAFAGVMEAYGRLKNASASPALAADGPPAPADVIVITPEQALKGGSAEHGGLAIHLPAGLRAGDTLRAGEAELRIAIRNDGALQVHGDDLWISAAVAAQTLARGGRLSLETPAGLRDVWITRKAADQGLTRLDDEGLPARGLHPQGHLYVRLAAEAKSDSAARTRLRAFAATWAA